MLGDVSFTTEGIVVIGGLLGALVTAVVFLFKLYDKSKDRQINDLISERNSYREMAAEAVAAVESNVNELRTLRGQPRFVPIAPVVPEHNSPVTPAQQDTADLQTIRARLTAATLALGLPAREAGQPVTEVIPEPAVKPEAAEAPSPIPENRPRDGH